MEEIIPDNSTPTSLKCLLCNSDSDNNVLCRYCNKTASKIQIKQAMEVWHRIITQKGLKKHGAFIGLYRCYHCGGHFPRNMVCGDHFPYTKGSRSDLQLDVRNGVCSCMQCNTSGNKHRKFPTFRDMQVFLS